MHARMHIKNERKKVYLLLLQCDGRDFLFFGSLLRFILYELYYRKSMPDNPETESNVLFYYNL